MSDDDLYKICMTTDKGFLISGRSNSTIGGDKTENNLGIYQAWIVKTDSMGNKEWDKTIFTTGFDGECIVVQSSENCYTIAVQTNGGIGGYKTEANWDNTVNCQHCTLSDQSGLEN